MFLLDTNTLIYFFKGRGNVAKHLLSVPPTEIALSSISLYEIEVGIAKSPQPAKRRRQFDGFLSVVSVVPFDRSAARVVCRRLRQHPSETQFRDGTRCQRGKLLVTPVALGGDVALDRSRQSLDGRGQF